ncbi:tRNA 5-methylaminomethyl-2-thiouridine biosynthesis bifunctional protein MnmC [Chromobacterium violaceum]|uniref:tRNA 5-methylaminomethyl-2-thiouridine biosynthesis bifunctional protein MnmC n=1 Tax=Chromobacterium violaceum TaxID=536 RepID=A0A447TBQ4_CHRVL|nr:tRNA 5-methylaminomethyl-2-thiouridine biosynthesis bifunctional protein MnmC [Chromobacterium violaceum]
MHPPALVRQLADHPNIVIKTGRTALTLDYDPAQRSWTAGDEQGPLAVASVVVLAGAAETAQFDSTRHLPLKKIRGQITSIPASEESSRLRTVLCGEGYISPRAAAAIAWAPPSSSTPTTLASTTASMRKTWPCWPNWPVAARQPGPRRA